MRERLLDIPFSLKTLHNYDLCPAKTVRKKQTKQKTDFHCLSITALCQIYYLACVKANRHSSCYKLIHTVFVS